MADNTVTLIGNLTRDPELRFTTGGRGIASFGLAVNRRYQVNGEWQEKTSFFNVTCWDELGENAAASAHQGHPRHRHRPARAAQLGDPGGREAHRRRGRRRRGRPEPALGPRPDRAQRALIQRRRLRRWQRAAAAAAAAAGAASGPAPANPIRSTATKSRSDPFLIRPNPEEIVKGPTMTAKKPRARVKDANPRSTRRRPACSSPTRSSTSTTRTSTCSTGS